ncbi:MAG TPA: DMT family transporter [Thermodesulfobacteriota bacterium]|mgnify:CR=1 FL=1|nr:DMT family transporter [Thermodesulfobacteriota bacterium]
MRREYWYLILAGIFYGTIAPGGQLLLGRGLSLFETAFYRPFIVGLILLPAVLARRDLMPGRGALGPLAVYGLVGGLLELALFAGLALGVPVAIAVLLLYTQPVWTIFIGRLALGEEITGRKLVSAVLGLVGLACLLQSWEAGAGPASYIGIACGLLSGILLSLWVVLGKRISVTGQHYVTTTFGWSAFASAWLLLLLPLMKLLLPGDEFSGLAFALPAGDWLALVIVSVLGGAVPHLLFYRGLRGVPASVAGIVLLLEPASATVLAWAFLVQHIGFYTLLGGAFILLSNYIVVRRAGGSGGVQ